MTRARLLAIAVGLPVVLIAGWCGLWLWSAGALESALAEWQAQQRQRGIEVAFAGPEIAGFPTGLSARFGEPRAVGERGWRWNGPEVTGAARVWSPFTIETLFPGRHRLGVIPAPDAPEVEIEADAARASARATLRRNGTLEQADVEIGDLRILAPTGEPITAALLSGRFEPLAERGEDGLARIALAARGERISLPERLALPLGRDLELASLDAVLIGEIPPGAPRDALARWRETGGQLDVQALSLIWGPMRLEAEGSASLDEAFRPIGAFTARVHGLIETIDALARAGVIPSGQALAVRIAVLALGGSSGEGGGADLEVPITLQEGRLYLGPVPLLPISPVL